MTWYIQWTRCAETDLVRHATVEAADVFQAIVRATVASGFAMGDIRCIKQIPN